jgi:hypothetical protein
MDLLELESGVVPKRHWYYRSKARLLRTLVDRHAQRVATIWDVGAGSGFFTAYMLANTPALGGLCIDPNYPAETNNSVSGKPMRFRRLAGSGHADLILLMDVLEHVDDPVGLLREYVDAAPSGCIFIITVPAHQWLWSTHDVYLGHRRRYTRSLLEETAQLASLEVLECGYYFASILPLVAAMRKLRRVTRVRPTGSDLSQQGRIASSVLAGALTMERRLVGLNRLAGVTVVAVGRKP